MGTLGKCLGSGTALSAFAGRREVMEAVAGVLLASVAPNEDRPDETIEPA
jgi:glutamate-1-semialdehyde aminotransferase